MKTATIFVIYRSRYWFISYDVIPLLECFDKKQSLQLRFGSLRCVWKHQIMSYSHISPMDNVLVTATKLSTRLVRTMSCCIEVTKSCSVMGIPYLYITSAFLLAKTSSVAICAREIYRKIFYIRLKNSSCFYVMYWSQVFSREWLCNRRSADMRCSSYIWVFNNFIVY